MWRWVNAFWGTVAAYINITGWGLFLCGLAILDKPNGAFAIIFVVIGAVMGVIGWIGERRIRKATAEGRTFNHKLRV